MREIKFRAWDTLNKDMFIVNPVWWEEAGVWDYDEDDYAKIADEYGRKLMQYTGLRDKNGKAIYEGDIVKVLHGGWGSKPDNDTRTLGDYLESLTKRYEVVFTQGEFVGKRNTGSYNPWSTDNEGNAYTSLVPETHGFIEVIGNIYETPELLTPDHLSRKDSE